MSTSHSDWESELTEGDQITRNRANGGHPKDTEVKVSEPTALGETGQAPRGAGSAWH